MMVVACHLRSCIALDRFQTLESAINDFTNPRRQVGRRDIVVYIP